MPGQLFHQIKKYQAKNIHGELCKLFKLKACYVYFLPSPSLSLRLRLSLLTLHQMLSLDVVVKFSFEIEFCCASSPVANKPFFCSVQSLMPGKVAAAIESFAAAFVITLKRGFSCVDTLMSR